ncbi:hypothetical protein [Streptomyces sp. DASNCL29]|uniref:hypothetical protein n=1 Tax=Streptomyces sp. DASNCL29 TaxID=2583819 RepID=UPI00110FA53E|nr:hypothetical protein [Streptomyces sp. DASNCL29]TMV00051.1 hypothetical protein FGK60_21880 [Streptomyces sp. DASNCL29]
MQPLARRAVGNVAIIGSTSGFGSAKPNVPLQIGSEAEARQHFATLQDGAVADEGRSAGPLYHAVRTALLQNPGPSRVYAIPTADVAEAPGYGAALTVAAALPVQLVCLAGEVGPAPLELLKDHVDEVSAMGSARMGVAMVDPELAVPENKTFAQAANDAYTNLKTASSRMILVAARVAAGPHGEPASDVAAAVTGAIAGFPPHTSVLMKQIREVRIPLEKQFSGTEIKDLAEAFIIPVIDPELIPGEGLFLGSGRCYTTDPQRLYVDVIRVLDHIEFVLKAGLIGSIGDTRIDRLGMQALRSRVNGLLSPLLGAGIITDYTIDIPLLPILEAEEAQRSPGQETVLGDARTERRVEVLLSVTYAGAIHFLDVKLALKS